MPRRGACPAEGRVRGSVQDEGRAHALNRRVGYRCLGNSKDRRATMNKNTICLWYDHDAEEAARFYARTFPDSKVVAVHKAPSDYPGGKAGDVLTVDFTVCGLPCMGINGGDTFK